MTVTERAFVGRPTIAGEVAPDPRGRRACEKAGVVAEGVRRE